MLLTGLMLGLQFALATRLHALRVKWERPNPALHWHGGYNLLVPY